jgi:glucose/arabinose dehydrogenase
VKIIKNPLFWSGTKNQVGSTPFGKFNKSHIFSIGHRNPQGLINLDDDIYSVEHGPKGGDEINLVKLGQNYGWPLYSFGSKYADGSAYPANFGIKGFTAPIYTFIPSIGISNVVKCPYVLTNRYAPAKCLLIGSLRANSVYVVLLNSSNRTVLSVEQMMEVLGVGFKPSIKIDES